MSTQERPMRADARRNHGRLIDAARQVFTTRGAEAPLDDVARLAGVGPGTLYRHFPTREALLVAVYRQDVESLAATAGELAATRPPAEALAGYLQAQLRYVREQAGLATAVKAMLHEDSETFAYCRGTMRGALGRLVEAAQAAGVVRTDVDAIDLLRLVHAVGVATESAPDQAERLLAVVLDGLRPA